MGENLEKIKYPSISTIITSENLFFIEVVFLRTVLIQPKTDIADQLLQGCMLHMGIAMQDFEQPEESRACHLFQN